MRRLPTLTAAALLMLVVSACAQSPQTPAARARAVESQVWSPYCAGRLLADCTTRQADDLRAQIERRIAAGDTDAELMAWLRANYGDEVLASPAPGPAGALIWLLPALALGVGVVLVVNAVIRWHRRRPAAVCDASEPQGDDEWVQRVRDEVERGL